jgi:aconitase B
LSVLEKTGIGKGQEVLVTSASSIASSSVLGKLPIWGHSETYISAIRKLLQISIKYTKTLEKVQKEAKLAFY